MPNEGLSIKFMFLNADPVVQGVMVLLFIASLVSWAIIFEKTILLRRLSSDIRLFKKMAPKFEGEAPSDSFSVFNQRIITAGITESLDVVGRETRADFRERVERSMRLVLAGRLDRAGARVMFLATVGASSPFIGLFGTVWGIMHSFIGIAASGETTLAVVAPGIAEALFATAMGLVAAIPAVIAYNKINGTMKAATKEALGAISILGNRLAKFHFSRLEDPGVGGQNAWKQEN